MGRKRVIDQEAILDAAERVVGRDGSVNLTLEAVAKEAGISKASVLYDYRSKQALIEKIVERAFKRDNEHHAAVESHLNGGASCAILGRIAAAALPPPEAFRAVALNLSAALTLDDQLRQKMRVNQAAIIDRVLDTAASPRGALLAYLALEGVKLLEHLDFHQFAPAERARIISEITWLAHATPQAEGKNDE
jgi:AcrR family transcriptional regulator